MVVELCKISQPPQFLQLLRPDGTLYSHVSQDRWYGSLDEIVSLYVHMFRGRQFGMAARSLKAKGLIGTFPSAEGQEALDAALISAMRPEDMVLFSYRMDTYLLERGVPAEQIYQYWGGDERGSVFPKGIGAYPFSIPIGTHTTLAAGVAYAKKLDKKTSVVVCIVGDGGASKGDFYGAMNYAMLFSLPIVFVIANNQWAISTPRTKQSAGRTLAQKGIAVDIPEDRCRVVDGNDIFALRQTLFDVIENAREGGGPSVIEGITYRLADHTTVDHAKKYRDPKLVEEARKLDPLLRLHRFLERHGMWNMRKEEELSAETKEWLKGVITRYKAIEPCPVSDCFTYHYAALPPHLEEQMKDAEEWHKIILAERADEDTKKAYDKKAEAVKKEGSAISLPGETPGMKGRTMLEGINLALHYEMKRDPRLIMLAEDIGHGGVFGATAGLYDLYGRERVIDAPLDEASIIGVLIGYATQGNKAIGEAQFSGFALPMVDQLVSHASRLRNRTRGQITCPIVLRTPCYGGIGSPEHHSESIDWLAHFPGLKVVVASSPKRAYGLLLAAIRDPDPVIFCEPTALYRKFREEFEDDGVALPIGKCFVLCEGTNVTIAAYGGIVYETLEAADRLAQEGISAEVIDVATLAPLDMETILKSVEKTGRCVIVHEAPRTYGCGAEIAAGLAERGLLSLLAPIERVTGYDIIMPLAKMEAFNRPTVSRIIVGVRKTLAYA